jgi:hypothetical protein
MGRELEWLKIMGCAEIDVLFSAELGKIIDICHYTVISIEGK